MIHFVVLISLPVELRLKAQCERRIVGRKQARADRGTCLSQLKSGGMTCICLRSMNSGVPSLVSQTSSLLTCLKEQVLDDPHKLFDHFYYYSHQSHSIVHCYLGLG